jgi:hypothetical protein
MLIYFQKNRQITFKVTFVADGQLFLPYNPKDVWQWITFSAYFDPFNGPNKQKLLFGRSLHSSKNL